MDQGTSFIHGFLYLLLKADESFFIILYLKIKVFEQSKLDSSSSKELITYESSLKNDEKHSYCISSICAVRDETHNDRVILATTSNQNLTFWTLDSQSSRGQASVQVKMCPTINFNSELHEEDDDIEESTAESQEQHENSQLEKDDERPSKSYCSLQ